MFDKQIKFLFFANYFIGVLAIALSAESSVQLSLPKNSVAFYLLLFCATVLYYTHAYRIPVNAPMRKNLRQQWYADHQGFVSKCQLLFSGIILLLIAYYLICCYQAIIHLSAPYWIIIITIPLAGLLYYGLLPASFIDFNLRNTGWLKSFVIGFVWACCVNLLPLLFLRIEKGASHAELVLVIWLFIKNWMFCTVNAIMFDFKDYAEDSNQQLKTFVVRVGLRKTIYFVLIPLLLIGITAFTIFAWLRQFGLLTYLFNLVPFLCLILVARSLHRRKTILFYLIVIDGLLLLKAFCGIAGMQFIFRK